MSEVIRILIANDFKIMRRGVGCLIASQPGMEVVGETADDREAVEAIRNGKPDIVLVLTNNGFFDKSVRTIMMLKQENPSTRILVVSNFMSNEQVYLTLRMGILGFVLKDQSPEELFGAIRSVSKDKSSLNSAVIQRMIQGISVQSEGLPPEEQLSDREVEILKFVAEGLANKAIADKLAISERTVRTHVSNILAKLDLENRTQAALYALRNGLARLQ